MILAINWVEYSLYFLYASLLLLVVIIAYRYLLRRFNKDVIEKEDYIELFSFENQVAKGEVTLFFQVFSTKQVNFYLTDAEGNILLTFVDEVRKPGGYNVSFDSTKLINGKYYYCIKTENQQTDKLLVVQN